MASVNKAIILGNLGKDPETKFGQNGNAVCRLSVATTEKWKDKFGQMQEKTEWHRISVFGKQAENCGKYLKKGSGVYVEGRIETREYEKDGQKRYSTEIVASDVRFVGGKSEPKQDPGAYRGPPSKPVVDDEDLPF
jgi:single-strand DNA-binding protein